MDHTAYRKPLNNKNIKHDSHQISTVTATTNSHPNLLSANRVFYRKFPHYGPLHNPAISDVPILYPSLG